MEITSNFPIVIADILSKINMLDNPETVSRAVASAIMPEMRKRIHVDGNNSKGSKIGTYSTAYLKLRQKKYNRTADSDVIISLTRQLENSYVLGATTFLFLLLYHLIRQRGWKKNMVRYGI